MDSVSYWSLDYLWLGLGLVLRSIVVIVPLFVCVILLIYMERKVIGAMQLRKGPNVVGPFGILQAVFDGVKLLLKEVIVVNKSSKFLFFLAPVLVFGLALIAWAPIPLTETFVLADINFGLLFVLVVSALNVYGIVIAGWASNSRYPFLGAIRSSAQMISYGLSINTIALTIAMLAGTFNLRGIIEAQRTMWFAVPLFPLFILFFICILAETNRHPFDLPEAESELVSGYNVEYSSMPFALFFLGEYANMILMSTFAAILFLGGWLPPFNIALFNSVPSFFWLFLKVIALLFIFIWLRAAIPRYRYDQLMKMGWKVFLPFSFTYFVAVSIFTFFA